MSGLISNVAGRAELGNFVYLPSSDEVSGVHDVVSDGSVAGNDRMTLSKLGLSADQIDQLTAAVDDMHRSGRVISDTTIVDVYSASSETIRQHADEVYGRARTNLLREHVRLLELGQRIEWRAAHPSGDAARDDASRAVDQLAFVTADGQVTDAEAQALGLTAEQVQEVRAAAHGRGTRISLRTASRILGQTPSQYVSLLRANHGYGFDPASSQGAMGKLQGRLAWFMR